MQTCFKCVAVFSVVAGLSMPLQAAGRPADPKQAEAARKGIEYMLKVQGKDGGWGKGETMTPVVPAITALTVMAVEANLDLLPENDPLRAKAKAACARGYDLFFNKAPVTTGKVKLYDMRQRNWDNLVRALYLLRLPRNTRTKEQNAKLQKLVNALESSQEGIGGWTYIANWNAGMDKSTTFLTSFVVLILMEARHQGCKVSDDVLDKATAYMKKMRTNDGPYLYYQYTRPSKEMIIGSCSRNVANELSLFMVGESDAKKLQWTLENFFHYRHELEKVRSGHPDAQQRQRLQHWGTGGIASYYFYYSHFFVNETLCRLDPQAKIAVDLKNAQLTRTPEECQADVVKIIIDTQNKDGSWGTTAGNDTHYNSALALFTLSGKRLFACPPAPAKPQQQAPAKKVPDQQVPKKKVPDQQVPKKPAQQPETK